MWSLFFLNLPKLPSAVSLRVATGRAMAMRLQAAGLNTRCPRCGIHGWQAAMHLLVDTPGTSTP